MINEQNAQNVQNPNIHVSHSNFPLERHVFGTFRFGEYAPFFFFDGVGSDKIKQRSITTTRSFSLKAPLMEDVQLKRDYICVYYDALLPINWQKIYVNPKHGDDVDASLVGCTVTDFFTKVHTYMDSLWSLWQSSVDTDEPNVYMLNFFKYLVTSELFFSDGNLLSALGIHLSSMMRYSLSLTPSHSGTFTEASIDTLIDHVCTSLLAIMDPTIENDYIIRYFHTGDNFEMKVTDAISMRQFFQFLREGDVSGMDFNGDYINQVTSLMQDGYYNYLYQVPHAGSVDVSLARPAAYQIACAHFFTNDNVDYIYSADLWRSYLGSLVYAIIGSYDSFVYNGVSYQYDFLSAYYFNNILSNSSDFACYPYLYALFGFKRSLRFMDYFSGARTQPLAVGDVSVAVEDNKVSVVDINRNTQVQRLLNNVLRLPSKIDEYIKGLFPGSHQTYDYHNPGWLAHTTDVVYTAEVENTSDAQTSRANSITSNFKGASSDMVFEFEIDKPCIILGIQYFDIRRAYYSGVDRLAQHVDRFDMFMPELQYIGDQDVKANELVACLGSLPISYTARNMEYKQVIDQAFGGFVDQLPGWAFLFNPYDWRIRSQRDGYDNAKLSPNFVRSVPQELDPFFISLSGFSLGHYFHFQQKIVNITEADRPMTKDPQILG